MSVELYRWNWNVEHITYSHGQLLKTINLDNTEFFY